MSLAKSMNPLFSNKKVSWAEQSDALCQAVMTRIAKRRAWQRRGAIAAYGGLFVSAVVALIPAWQYAAERAAASGFADYLSLLASDGFQLLGSWHALLLSLAESAPIVGMTAVLATTVAAIYAVRQLVLNINDLRYSSL